MPFMALYLVREMVGHRPGAARAVYVRGGRACPPTMDRHAPPSAVFAQDAPRGKARTNVDPCAGGERLDQCRS